ncbi:DUF2478 domain-containing protein [Gluconacetobacter azotocaptans]|uniref:DUF2478 domain-containing protein n=1 Tax=Gluconacetobacter azotocaptans TaxID=142834 RepID=A0A7W4JT25_9PROT|nr:DUF2478 domain-containing protein [Gluconacetobacter azotocaptans]MBB2190384.1 DUF2478 domain-containing protein [Gluconacetobacter azotocaptans]GBQ30098.1 hypothetical protein AA13594_1607 [Gluconacetobacter azotocaptans DSM 13594]
MTVTAMRQPALPIATLLQDDRADLPAVLTDAVAALKARGQCVGGVVQYWGRPLPNGRHEMFVTDVVSNERMRLDTPGGADATACSLDITAFGRVSAVLRDHIAQAPDILMINRFGLREAEGHGLRAEIAEAIMEGIPVVIVVPARFFAAWEVFLGGAAHVVAPSAQAILRWSDMVRGPSRAITMPVGPRHGHGTSIYT